MLFDPSLPRLGSGTKEAAGHLPPAKLYLPRQGISAAWQTEEEPYAGQRVRRSRAQKAGLTYQRRVGSFLESGAGNWRVIPSPWFAYCDWSGGKRRYCQPDFLLVDEGASLCVIVEVKIRWTTDAWWQLEKLYRPVLVASKRWQTLLSLCICRGYDPLLPAPVPPTFIDDVYSSKPGQFNFLIFK